MKTLKLKAFMGKNIDLGQVGTPTPIKDQFGEELKVGDVVYFTYTDNKSTMHALSVIALDKEKAFLLGLHSEFESDGTYHHLVITKLRDCNEMTADDMVDFGNLDRIVYCEEGDE